MNQEEKKYHFSASDPLHALDTETQTYGCRCYNPDICKNYGSDKCGLTNDEHICFVPSRKWKEKFNTKQIN